MVSSTTPSRSQLKKSLAKTIGDVHRDSNDLQRERRWMETNPDAAEVRIRFIQAMVSSHMDALHCRWKTRICDSMNLAGGYFCSEGAACDFAHSECVSKALQRLLRSKQGQARKAPADPFRPPPAISDKAEDPLGIMRHLELDDKACAPAVPHDQQGLETLAMPWLFDEEP